MDCTESLIYINGHIDGINTEAEEALLRDGLWTHRVEQVVRELSEKKKKK